MITVGYDDAYPVTTEGRVVAIIPMVCGVGLFRLIAAWFTEPTQKRGEDDLEALRNEVANLRQAIDSMTQTLATRTIEPQPTEGQSPGSLAPLSQCAP